MQKDSLWNDSIRYRNIQGAIFLKKICPNRKSQVERITKMKQDDITLLHEVYKNCQQMINSLVEIIPRSDQFSLFHILNGYSRDLLEVQRNTLEVSAKANDNIDQAWIMSQINTSQEAKKITVKAPVEAEIAKEVINHSTMAIGKIEDFLTKNIEYNIEVEKIANDCIRLEENHIQKMKHYC